MYITTFYSFKGGVGRTMALANVAVQLAFRGRKVLVVDFDIEAPGLDTFDEFRPAHETPGVIDFVREYLSSAQAPNVANFIGECATIGDQGGQLWIMPSGKTDTYSSSFAQVDWNELYKHHDGYLLFEDLKEQWKHCIEPDYVLIDSRTGHTDTSGICTRQLPDAVAIFFFPNEQNLRGLTEVVRDIRSEADGPRKKNIELHFVMSNVPDLDDEDQILDQMMGAFRDQLNLRREPMIVHRYHSLSLLNQVVFSKDRPRSRLAREYGAIVREISIRNWNDREGALEYMERLSGRWRWRPNQTRRSYGFEHRERTRWRDVWKERDPFRRDEMLQRIERAHANDGEVLFSLAEQFDDQPEIANSLYSRAIDAGYEQPEAYLTRSRIREEHGNLDSALEDTWRVLNSDRVTEPMVSEAIRRLAKLGIRIPESIVRTPAVVGLDTGDKFWLARKLSRFKDDLPIALSLLEQILDSSDLSADGRVEARHQLGVTYMGLGRCSDATKTFRSAGRQPGDLNIRDAFNYGMAMWGLNGRVETEVFLRVVEIHQDSAESERDPNYFQCMAIAFWITGNSGKALEYAGRARQTICGSRRPIEFSCWRYLPVSAETFLADLDELCAMIETGKPALPRFARCATNKSNKGSESKASS